MMAAGSSETLKTFYREYVEGKAGKEQHVRKPVCRLEQH
jgi:hypothetical protein